MNPRLARMVYTLAFTLALPLVFVSLLWRSRRLAAYRWHWAERLARYDTPRPAGPLIWIHAVSVGETNAARPLVEALQKNHPDCALLITHMTPTGRDASIQLFGNRMLRVYLPYDLPWLMRRFLRYFRPGLGILMETEVWPNLVEECARAKVPLVLANARLSEKSFVKAQQRGALIYPAVSKLACILAQTPADAERLGRLARRPDAEESRERGKQGEPQDPAPRIVVTGNVKFDISAPDTQRELGRAFRQRFGARPILLAASTREGEEALLLDAWQEALAAASARSSTGSIAGMRANPPLLIVVPRHPQRFDDVAELAQARGLVLQRRSDGQPVATATQIWLGDSMGEMFAYYAAADVAFVGGSLLPLGGQNLIEACAVGCPVLIGPHTFNFAQASEDAVACGAAVRIANAKELSDTALELFRNAARRAAMAQSAERFANAHRGATTHTLRELAALIDAAQAAR